MRHNETILPQNNRTTAARFRRTGRLSANVPQTLCFQEHAVKRPARGPCGKSAQKNGAHFRAPYKEKRACSFTYPKVSSLGKVFPTIRTSSYSFKSFVLLTFPNFILIHITSGKKQNCCQSAVLAEFLLSGLTPRTLLKRCPTSISC